MSQATLGGRQRLRPPPIPRWFLPRTRVVRALDDAGPGVVCLQAPGGYGKTTVLAQWAAQEARPVVWLSVRPAAADPQWLAQALLDALYDEGLVAERVPLPGSGDSVSWHLSTLPVVEEVVSSVARPCGLVIDDAGAMSGAPWEALVESLAVSLPEGSTLALSTREAVPATLWRLHSRGLVHVVGPDALAFDEAEASALMTQLGVPASPEEVQRLVHETEGWPVALYLVGLSAASGSPGLPLSTTGITGLDAYLRADIRDKLSSDDAEFLERVSVANVLDAEVCDAVTGARDSLARLRRLASENHLLAPQDATATRFRMHPLLAQFLCEDLKGRDPDSWRAAHDAVGRIEERRGDIDGAVHHAKLAGDDDRLEALVWQHASQQLAYSRWATVQRWLSGLDPDRVSHHCGLALSSAWVSLQAGDIPRMKRLAVVAAEAARDGQESYRPAVGLLEAAVGAQGLGHIESASRTYLESPPTDARWRSLAYFLLGTSLVLRDEVDEGVDALTEGYRRAEEADAPIVMAHCLAALADVALAREDEHRALLHVRELRTLASSHRLDASVSTAPIFITSTVGYVVEGRYADARHEASRALRLTSLMRDAAAWHGVRGRLALAQVNIALGDPERATVLLEEARDVRGPSNASPVLDRMLEETEQRLSQVTMNLVGSSSLTTAEVRVLQYLPTHLSFPQIADELVVSRHTVKTQALSAYRKLGVHTRTQAIERARKAGLLPPA